LNYLITGGAGFMGSNFIRYILNKYPRTKIINLDKLTYAGNLDNLKNIKVEKHRYQFIKGDIANQGIVERIFAENQIGVVVNMAAESHVDRSILGPRAFVKTDVLGVLNLLEAARQSKIKKFVQVSTDEVYGEIPRGLFKEDTRFNPRSPYAASKAGGDHLILAYHYTYGLPVVRVHSCNFYGPYQHPEKFIPLFITNLLENKKVPLYGNGQQMREWIFTEDFCRALDLVINKGQIGHIYNIGTGYRRRNIETAKLIVKLTGSLNKNIVQFKDRPGHDRRYAIDASKIRKLGFKPKYTFIQGLRATVKWYKENEWWWRKIKQKRDFQEYYERQYGGLL
jgi:dTDP-glucose 4,6-dehydratase